ncbi:E3 ubiquitin ligase TRAF3IP2 isoform X2 [Mugil cephalus]|nr:E3 ubiquitin ligase TRAF3IP2 isoform X2 [Mugil cephalus]XP_047443234.1 E3 ubiquitin ligase TRAF3IP2 isoform X2 [Mugil cephalus]
MMLPTSVYPACAPNNRHQSSSRHNTPEEDDETMSSQEASVVPKMDSNLDGHQHQSHPHHHHHHHPPHPHSHHHHPDHSTVSDDALIGRQKLDREQEVKHVQTHSQTSLSFCSSQSPRSLPAPYSQPTPFPSQPHPSIASSWSRYPNSLLSCLSQKDYSSCSGESCLSRHKYLSLPDRYSTNMSSLEQPLSLHSNPPSADLCHHTLSPYSCPPQGAACCAQCPADAFNRGPALNKHPWPQYHPANSPYDPGDCRLPGPGFAHLGHNAPVKEKHLPLSTPLSLEQRRVFVTYEADNDKHVNEIINFVALLRHNGFDTHIDIFEQQFRSISKIDFMERYLSEKEYLIIIIISPKYYDTVTASPVGLENDERTFNTVYIHKQLQNEFIQNGSKNFRFIPILFPGAKKCHVPNWLLNTHVYGWPRDRDDILRRLMRIEKYNPPPIGELPTIVSIPLYGCDLKTNAGLKS